MTIAGTYPSSTSVRWAVLEKVAPIVNRLKIAVKKRAPLDFLELSQTSARRYRTRITRAESKMNEGTNGSIVRIVKTPKNRVMINRI